MKMTKLVTISAAMLLSVSAARAVHAWEDPGAWWGSHFRASPAGTMKFNANEISLDLFGSFVAPQRGIENVFDTNIRSGHWGGGLGLNYFLLRELGVGVDTNIPADGGRFFNHVSGSLIVRLPIESIGLAPYIYGGGGRGTDPVYEWLGHAGVGFELRANPVTGFFVDARYIWAEHTSDDLLLSAGVRLVF
jgi:hypothetical protein